jgi:hypothetical protein
VSKILIVVDDAATTYPLTVDPLAQQAYLKASNTGTDDLFGWSVAVAGDTVVVGAPNEDSSATGVNGNQSDNSALNAGAAYVFVRSGGVWSQQAYLKASNTEVGDNFGFSVAVAGDTVVVGVPNEDSSATGVNGNQSDNSVFNAGAAYVFGRSGGVWSQQAYLKASNTGTGDQFGWSVAVAGDTVVVGAVSEDSSATGINAPGGQSDNSAFDAGAAYVFVRSGGVWSQQAYLKASNTDQFDYFSYAVAVAGDAVVVGAFFEDSSATGVNGNQSDNSASQAGAAYVFVRSGGVWSQQAYLKASNTGANDQFGYSVAVAGDTVVVGAPFEDSNATGVNGNQTNNSASSAGAAYVFLNAPASEMAVLGNGQVIADGDATPSTADHTDFGSVSLGGAITRTFTISNSGDLDLNLTGSPVVSITGAAAGDFSLVASPTTPVISNTTTTFQVRFDPTVVGTRAATVTIANDDGDENPYDYAIQGTGSNTAPMANAGTDQSVGVGASVTLDGSGSSDPDGHTPLTYGWTQTGGPAVTLSSATAVSPTFTAPGSPTVLTFSLTVTDSFGLADPTPDEVVVTVTSNPPEMAVLGNGIIIADGDTSPTAADHTDFGSVALGGALTRTFTISNSGTGSLTLTGSPVVSITGPRAGDFTVVSNPTTPVAAGGTTTFQVRFSPSVTGTRVATVTIANNDSNENPYDFAIQGSGTSVTTQLVYLPLIFKNFSAASDLVIDALSAGSGGVEITIRNAGDSPITNAFWVDVYFNPNPAPPHLNQPWDTIAEAGAVWGVTKTLNPGESLILTSGGPYYFADKSSASFPARAQVYGFVDSINFSTTYGNVQESNEGNNVFGPVVSTTADSDPVTGAAVPSSEGLPER